jgi:ParB/RepB/Spo0J family partition protein
MTNLRVEMIPVDSILVNISRQREDKDVSDILSSIQKHGVITPIVVTTNIDGDITLIAGERRLLASKQAGLKEIPARFLADLDRIERQVIELEENLHRKDLEWKELVLSVQRIHQLHLAENSSWTILQTAQSINYRDYSVGCMLRVAEELARGDKQIAACANWSTAFNIVARKEARRADDAFNELMEEPHEREPAPSKASVTAPSESQVHSTTSLPSPLPAESSILQGEFVSWASVYSGPLFNFVHCDFPYGIGLDRSAQGNSAQWGGYQDGVKVYWSLIEALVLNIDRIMAPSSHLMFWLSSDYDTLAETVEYFKIHTNLRINSKPLIWFKSDNRGILPDPKRGPRHVYETAIFAARAIDLSL